MKVLILTGKFGMGHYSASNSLSEDIKAKFDNSEITIKDIFEYIMPNYSDKMYKTFSILVNREVVFIICFINVLKMERKI